MKKNDDKIYNVKILRNYVSYLESNFSMTQDQIEEVFRNCKIDYSILESDTAWFNQDVADKFYAEMLRVSKDKEIAYKVGQFMVLDSNKGIAGRIVSTLATPSMALKRIGHIGTQFSLGSKLSIAKLKKSSAIICSKIQPNCTERQYQCKNRWGMLAAVPKLFGLDFAIVEHPKCFHKGDEFCEYHMSWKNAKNIGIKLHALFSACALAFIVYQRKFSLGLGLACGSFFIHYLFLKFRRHFKNYFQQKEALEIAVKVMDRKHKNALLINYLSQYTSKMLCVADLFEAASNAIYEKMDYDRVLMLQVDEVNRKLVVVSQAGFDHNLSSFIMKTSFNIRPDNQSGFLVKVVNTKEPILVREVEKQAHLLSEKSKNFAKQLDTKSFLAVPIMFENKVLGVLAVDNHDSKKILVSEDLDLLSNVSDTLGIALSNALAYEKIQETLDKTIDLAFKENALKENFKKYVPANIKHKDDLHGKIDFGLKSEQVGIMFVDLMEFTQMCEAHSLELMAKTINIYIEKVNRLVVKYGGVVNKIMGDGMLIYFLNEKMNLIKCGISIIDEVDEINRENQAKGLPEIAIGIGAHYGECFLGNIGYDGRVDYTLIGDTVNTASRIESITREIGKNVFCVSDKILEGCPHIEAMPFGEISLKGKKEKIHIFSISTSKYNKILKAS